MNSSQKGVVVKQKTKPVEIFGYYVRISFELKKSNIDFEVCMDFIEDTSGSSSEMIGLLLLNRVNAYNTMRDYTFKRLRSEFELNRLKVDGPSIENFLTIILNEMNGLWGIGDSDDC